MHLIIFFLIYISTFEGKVWDYDNLPLLGGQVYGACLEPFCLGLAMVMAHSPSLCNNVSKTSFRTFHPVEICN